jgi:hypothetical protein
MLVFYGEEYIDYKDTEVGEIFAEVFDIGMYQ